MMHVFRFISRCSAIGAVAALGAVLVSGGVAQAQLFGRDCVANGGTNCTSLIPDGSGSLDSTVTIGAGCTSVSRVCLAFGVEHSETSDLSISLTHNAVSAPVPSSSTSPDLYRTQLYETEFDGEDGTGTWTLTLQDTINGDYGALNNWTLGLCCGTGAECDSVISASPASGLVTTEFGDTASFNVLLGCVPFRELTLGVASTDTTEGVPDVSTLTFDAMNIDDPHMVTSTGQDDPILDGDIPYGVVLTPQTIGAPFVENSPADLYNPPAVEADIGPVNVALVNLDNEADLKIQKEIVSSTPPVMYSITASNAGLSAVMASVQDNFPAGLTCTWTCTPSAGSTCTPGPVAGNINDIVTLPAGGSVTYTVTCDVSPGTTTLNNTATIIGPTTSNEVTPEDNSVMVSGQIGNNEPEQVPLLSPWSIAIALVILGMVGWLQLAPRRSRSR